MLNYNIDLCRQYSKIFTKNICAPQIHAEIDVINASWDEKGNNKGLADSIGIMVYEGTNSLNYVKNYVAGTSR